MLGIVYTTIYNNLKHKQKTQALTQLSCFRSFQAQTWKTQLKVWRHIWWTYWGKYISKIRHLFQCKITSLLRFIYYNQHLIDQCPLQLRSIETDNWKEGSQITIRTEPRWKSWPTTEKIIFMQSLKESQLIRTDVEYKTACMP